MFHLQPVNWREVATNSGPNPLRTNPRNELRAKFIEAMNRQIRWPVTFAIA